MHNNTVICSGRLDEIRYFEENCFTLTLRILFNYATKISCEAIRSISL